MCQWGWELDALRNGGLLVRCFIARGRICLFVRLSSSAIIRDDDFYSCLGGLGFLAFSAIGMNLELKNAAGVCPRSSHMSQF